MAEQWLLKRRIKRDSSASATESPTPSQDVAYGTEVGSHPGSIEAIPLSKWANKEGAPFFASPKPDDALTSAFDHVKSKSKQTWNTLDTSMSAAGAGAHALLSVESFIRCFMKSLPKEPMDAEAFHEWREDLKDSFKKKVVGPLSEASSCMAAIVNASVKEVRRLVMDAPACRSLKPTLKESPPSAKSFFGNPTDKINSAISNSFMLNSMGSNKNANSRFLATLRRFSQAKPSQKSNFSSKSASWKKKPAKKPGNDSRRPGRGGRSGQN